ncbi:MAG: DUF4388 domain-containing protein [Acidimicrobiia bacterium]|nr:DUF4388 domain-containing protein [Acidimicrobiia bacterium]
MALNGSLDDYSPAGALRVLSSTGKTGAVRFSGEAGCTVYLHRGQLYFARDEDTDHSLASALVRPGRLTAEDWTLAIEAAGDEPRVGELLVEQGAIDGDVLASVLLSIVYDPLIRLFREGDGAFEFEPDTVHWIGPHRTFNVDAIVNEVRRRVREVDEMTPFVPSTDAWVSAERTLPGDAVQVTLLREDWELIAALQGPRTIADLAMDMGRGRYSTARVVNRLAQTGLVRVIVDPSANQPTEAPVQPAAAVVETTTDARDDEPTIVDDDELSDRDDFDDVDATEDEDLSGDVWSGVPTGPVPHESGGGLSTSVYALPRRQPVALHEEPRRAERQMPWPASEDLQVDDPTTEGSIPGLEAIGGFRDAMAVDERSSAWTSSDPATHPNAAWLESLYAQYLDEPEAPGKRRKKEMLDVAFGAEEQDAPVKLPTLRRLLDAIKKL